MRPTNRNSLLSILISQFLCTLQATQLKRQGPPREPCNCPKVNSFNYAAHLTSPLDGEVRRRWAPGLGPAIPFPRHSEVSFLGSIRSEKQILLEFGQRSLL